MMLIMDTNPTQIVIPMATTFCLNFISILLGIAYLVNPGFFLMWDIFGIFLLASLFSDLLLVFAIDRLVNRHTPRGNQMNWMSYGLLIFIMVGLVTMALLGMVGGTLTTSQMVFFSPIFFGLFSLGFIYALFVGKYTKDAIQAQNGLEIASSKDPRRGTRIFGLLLCSILLGIMGYFAVLALAGASLGTSVLGASGAINGLATLVSGMFGGFWCFIALAATLFLVKVTRRYHKPRLTFAIGISGLVITSVLFAPMIETPAAAPVADASFAAAFGTNWNERIPSSVESHFLPTRVIIPAYYLGLPPSDCISIRDVLYFAGVGEEANIKLYFDAYLPPNNGLDLPGRNSTIIRIHGGAWQIGDKSMPGMLLVDRYLAAQGYCVFDFQYGLTNSTGGSASIFSQMSFANPPNVMGNFSIDDMMRQIGVFCQHLADHHIEYGANLSSTFISGGSAGGQLTCAVALAISNGSFTSYFGSALTIKGFVPFYPANGLAGSVDQGRSIPEFLDPTLLVDSTSPPCLIYQGTQDGLVAPEIAQKFKDAYTAADNPACAVIWMPMAGHGSDLYFSGYYNTFFLYYMERFLYLNQ